MKSPMPSTRRSFLAAAAGTAAGIALAPAPAVLAAGPKHRDVDSPAIRLARQMYRRGEFGALHLVEAELHGWPPTPDIFARALAALVAVTDGHAIETTRLRGVDGGESRFYDTPAGVALRIAVLPGLSRDPQPRLRFYGRRLCLFADDGRGETAVLLRSNQPPRTIDLRGAALA